MKNDCSIEIHTCIAPMLAHPIHSMEEVEKAMGSEGCTSAIMEYKYDGMRLQAHYDGSSVKLFSRHMLETTSQFPEVAEYLKEAFRVKDSANVSFIIDAEVVGVEGSGDGIPRGIGHRSLGRLIRASPHEGMSSRGMDPGMPENQAMLQLSS